MSWERGRIRARDLLVMSQPSRRAAPPRWKFGKLLILLYIPKIKPTQGRFGGSAPLIMGNYRRNRPGSKFYHLFQLPRHPGQAIALLEGDALKQALVALIPGLVPS